MELGQTKIIAIEGFGGTGKSTAAAIIAKHFGGVVINVDPIFFSLLDSKPKFAQDILKYPLKGISGREYFFKYLKTPEQYIELVKHSQPYVEEVIRTRIKEYIASGVSVVVFEGSTASNMYPWVGEESTKRILISANIEKLCKAFLARENGKSSTNMPQIIYKGLTQLIRPETADFIVYNDHENLADFQNTLVSLCELFGEDKNLTKPSIKTFAGLVN